MRWNLYITKWVNGQFSVYIQPDEPDDINWIDTLDSEGAPEAAEVRRIAADSGYSISFEELNEENLLYPHVLPEPSSLAELFEQSSDVVWPK